ncbi:MAG: PIN domain-containing protein [Thermomicrobiales bacterium]
MSESGALRAVVDTNLFVSGMISPGGRPSRLLDALRADRFELLLSDWQHAELTGVFDRPKIARRYPLTPEDTMASLRFLLAQLA